jgi:hypothetical protein
MMNKQDENSQPQAAAEDDALSFTQPTPGEEIQPILQPAAAVEPQAVSPLPDILLPKGLAVNHEGEELTITRRWLNGSYLAMVVIGFIVSSVGAFWIWLLSSLPIPVLAGNALPLGWPGLVILGIGRCSESNCDHSDL